MGAADAAVSALRRGLAPLLCAALCACANLPRLYESSDPLTAFDHFRLGAAYEAQGLVDDAGRQYEAVARLTPSDPEAWVALGDVEFKRGAYAKAEADFRRALKVSPAHPDALNNLAMTYLVQNKDLPEAERLAKQALRQDGPLRGYVLDTLAHIYRSEGRVPEALDAEAQASAQVVGELR